MSPEVLMQSGWVKAIGGTVVATSESTCNKSTYDYFVVSNRIRRHVPVASQDPRPPELSERGRDSLENCHILGRQTLGVSEPHGANVHTSSHNGIRMRNDHSVLDSIRNAFFSVIFQSDAFVNQYASTPTGQVIGRAVRRGWHDDPTGPSSLPVHRF